MIIDGRRRLDGKLKARVCIVGSGMGGASVAKKLVEAGVDVLFVEAGSATPAGQAAPIQHRIAGKSFGVPVTRAVEIGGSTNLWHGICAPFDPIDFETRPWIADSGWPITHRDLARHYDEALRWLGIDTPLPETREPEAAADEILAAKMFWTCRTPARLKDAVLEWARAGRARCLTHAVALHLRADEMGTVRSVTVGCGNRTIEITADVFVVAAGALETPRLLLNSGRVAGGAFGSGAAWTGRCLMDHPVGYFSQIVFHESQTSPFGPPVADLRSFAGFALTSTLQRRFQLPNHYAFVRPGTSAAKVPNDLLRSFLGVRKVSQLSPSQLLPLLTNRYILQRVARERLGLGTASRFGDIYIMAEQRPNRDSLVRLSENFRDSFGYPVAEVDWRMGPGEWDHFGAYFALVAEGLRRDDKVASLRIDPAEEWPQVLSSAAHHLGTARMAASPSHGVVDENLQVFGCRNLFVCDGSVFPTAGGTNPSLTTSALALRLGELLVKTMTPAAVARTV